MDEGNSAPVNDAPIDAPVQAEANEAQEWDNAVNELFPGLRTKQEKHDEPTEPKEGAENAGAPDPNNPDKKPDAQPGNGNDAKKPGDPKQPADGSEEEAGAPEPTGLDARLAARQVERTRQEFRNDVRDKMFPDMPTELRDRDGDPIRSIEDVMQLLNPNTGQRFTEEEAGQWFLHAQQSFNRELSNAQKQVDDIAEVHLDLKDQADTIKYRYGELLKALPEVADQVIQAYMETLVRDEKSGVITKAPLSMEKFYDIALKPYTELAQYLEEQGSQQTPGAPAQPAVDPAKQRQQERADRSDIYGGSQPDLGDDEDKEWASAAKSYFGNQLNRR